MVEDLSHSSLYTLLLLVVVSCVQDVLHKYQLNKELNELVNKRRSEWSISNIFVKSPVQMPPFSQIWSSNWRNMYRIFSTWFSLMWWYIILSLGCMKYSIRQCYYEILFRAVQIGFRNRRWKKSICKAVDDVEKMAGVTMYCVGVPTREQNKGIWCNSTGQNSSAASICLLN